MKPAEEFIKEHIPDCHEWADWGMEATVKAMKAYAREAIAEYLERAAREAIRFRDLEDDDTRELYENVRNIEIRLD